MKVPIARSLAAEAETTSAMADKGRLDLTASNSRYSTAENYHWASTYARSGKGKLMSTSTEFVNRSDSFTAVNRNSWPSTPACTSSDRRPKRKRSRSTDEDGFDRWTYSPCDDGFRKWTYSPSDCSYLKDNFIFISYNILGVENASNHPDLYLNVPPSYLEWDRRKELIRREIIHYNAGIVCFQEVDRFDDLADSLRSDGYRGTYKARTGDANDGCAIFWEEDRFTLLHEDHIEFKTVGLRDNVAQFCILKMNDSHLDSSLTKDQSSKSVIVGNIHVLFNPSRGDIKLGQIRMFIEKAQKLSVEWGSIPVVLAGDMNSVPQSAMYEFISSAKLDVLQHDRKKVSGQIRRPIYGRHMEPRLSSSSLCTWNAEELKLATGDEEGTHLRHCLNLSSAYLGVPGCFRTRDKVGEPAATSCHSKFLGTVDYIWHTAELIPVRVLETVPVDVLRRLGGLPSKRWGSDHLALVCEFALAESENAADRR